MLLGLGSLVIVLSARRSWCKIRELNFVQLSAGYHRWTEN